MASGLFGLSLEEAFIDTLAETFEAEDNPIMLTTSAYTADFTVHNFRDDVTNEVSGTGYTAGGASLTGTEITLASGLMTFDATDLTWSGSSITARHSVHYFNVGTAATDHLGFAHDFAVDKTSDGGDFTLQWNASGLWTLDYTP